MNMNLNSKKDRRRSKWGQKGSKRWKETKKQMKKKKKRKNEWNKRRKGIKGRKKYQIEKKTFGREGERKRGNNKEKYMIDCFLVYFHPFFQVISRRYPTETITDADTTAHIALLANTPTQAESLLHCLEQTAGDIGLYLNTNKTEYVF